MNKCKNCGTEFEGNCCPKCGTWANDEKTCPKCGAKLQSDANFCNECGFSFGDTAPQKQGGGFKKKIANLGKWIKTHLKIVIPVAVAILVAIILAISIPLGIKAKDNGTYYKLERNGEIDKKTYFVIKSGKWTDEEGESGKYKKSGDKITFYYTFFGETEEIASGTIKDGVLKIGDEDGEEVYISEKHKHKYGGWETSIEATCLLDGTATRSCACGVKETEKIDKLGHQSDDWLLDADEHYKICSVCNEEFNRGSHGLGSYCEVCGYPSIEVDGLKFILDIDKNEYCVVGSVDTTIKTLVIPAVCKGLPVTSIDSWAFSSYRNLESVTIPDSITYIGNNAFSICDNLKYNEYDNALYLGNSENPYLLLVEIKDTGLTSFTTNEKTKFIHNDVFYKCSSLTSITISNGVMSIGSNAFYGCTGLTSVTLPDSITFIGNSAFSGCSNLTSITIPNRVTHIESFAFRGCSNLTSIIIPDSVTYIDYGAFKDCSNLTIYCEAESEPESWDFGWNISRCTVIWGYKG